MRAKEEPMPAANSNCTPHAREALTTASLCRIGRNIKIPYLYSTPSRCRRVTPKMEPANLSTLAKARRMWQSRVSNEIEQPGTVPDDEMQWADHQIRRTKPLKTQNMRNMRNSTGPTKQKKAAQADPIVRRSSAKARGRNSGCCTTTRIETCRSEKYSRALVIFCGVAPEIVMDGAKLPDAPAEALPEWGAAVSGRAHWLHPTSPRGGCRALP